MTAIPMPAIKGTKSERILVMGESYYNQDGSLDNVPLHEIPSIVRNKWLETDKNEKWSIKYYDLIEEFLEKYNLADSLSDVTYYNYVQQIMSKPSEKPLKEDKIVNEEAFFQTIRQVEPEFIIVFSISTYLALPDQSQINDIKFVPRSNLKTRNYIYKSFPNRKYRVHWGYYEMSGKLIPILGLPHLTRINSQLVGNNVIEEILTDSGVTKF